MAAFAAALCAGLGVRLAGPGWMMAVLLSSAVGVVAAVLAGRTPRGALAPSETPESLQRAARLAQLEEQTRALRHDLRGILAPAMLVADRLSENTDPKIAKAGDTIVRAVNRASERLARTKEANAQGAAAGTRDEATPPVRR